MTRLEQKPAGYTVRRLLMPLRPLQYIAWLLFGLSGGCLILIDVWSLRLITRHLTSGSEQLQPIFEIILFYCAAAGLLKILQSQAERRSYASFNHHRMSFMAQLLRQYMTMDFHLYENQSFLDEAESAFRAVQNNQEGVEGMYHKMFSLLADLAALLLLSLLLWSVSPLIVAAFIVYILVSVWMMQIVSAYRFHRRERLSESRRRNAVYGSQASDFSYGKDTRLFSAGPRLHRYYQNEIDRLSALLRDFFEIEHRVSFLTIFFLVLCDLIAFILLIRQLRNGLPTADFVMYLSAVTAASLIATRLGDSLSFMVRELKYCQVMLGFADANLITEDSGTPFSSDGPVHIEFDHVTFTYPTGNEPVLENLSFSLEAGKCLALVGINGAGKTTIVKLLTGLYRPDSGRILLNGEDYTRFSIADLQRLFAVVFQEVSPLAVTVAENVAAAREGICRERVEDCLRQVGLWEKISRQAQGMDRVLFKIVDPQGLVLSGGENQKLLIARALYRRDARVLVMDEPTASLDALAEEKIYREMDQNMAGKTGLFISHRLASTRFCDEILLLDNGRIAERGTHDQLMARDGSYAHMFRTQGRYYQEAGDEEA